MKELGLTDRLPRIACAQAEQANPFYLSFKGGFQRLEQVEAGPTLASAIQIGNPVSYERAQKVVNEFDGLVEQASESELANAAAQADLTGLYTCPQTGVALAVLLVRPSDCRTIVQGVEKQQECPMGLSAILWPKAK